MISVPTRPARRVRSLLPFVTRPLSGACVMQHVTPVRLLFPVLCAAAVIVSSIAVGSAQKVGLPRSTPEAQGISSAAVLQFVEAAEQKLNALHSIMIVRHGQVVAEG